ncbi:MAG: bifunctional ornithine acetyltransferase/N-acetylglutamate synthase, partial [Deltaproteobacteria bacterium]|nr:bifunctional ornithine acetyltransferase/N-acetylglutamate synthase [Deltaproteobacteria bacterium]
MKNIMCQGFKAAGVASGLKKKQKKDLGIIYSDVQANVAGVFTKNKILAAPVILDRERIKSGVCRAVIANSGNANCCTGQQGMKDAEAMTKFAASALEITEDLVLVASTGVIGQPLAVEKIEKAVPRLVESMTSEGFSDFAEAIMTTYTVPKMISMQG